MRRTNCFMLLASTAVLLLAVSPPAQGRVKLITLPVRERVAVHLDHPEATLVEEERIVPLNEGVNKIDFSWANTRIDPRTIVFRVIEPMAGEDAGGADQPQGEDQPSNEPQTQEAEGSNMNRADQKQPAGQANRPMKINVLSVSYPPDEKALVWAVSATAAGAARVRISYLLGGLDKGFNYRAIAAHDESTLTLSQYIRVKNFANEQYEDTTITAGLEEGFEKPIGADETIEMLVREYEQVPIKKTYTADLAKFGYLDQQQNKLRVPMHYVLRNDKQHNLGRTVLPRGKVRIFQRDAAGEDATTAFLGEDWGRFTPIDEKMKLYLGLAQDVVVKRTIAQRDRRPIAGDLSHYEVVIQYEIENFKDEAITLDVSEQIDRVKQKVGIPTGRPAEWVIGDRTTFDEGPDPEETTQNKVVLHTDLPAREGDDAKKVTRKLHLIFRNVVHPRVMR